MESRTLVTMLAVGAVAGYLAGVLVGHPRWGLIGSVVAGVIGGVVGGWLLDAAKVRSMSVIGSPTASSRVRSEPSS